MSSVRDIQRNAKEIKTLLKFAKHGKWEGVWLILGEPSAPRQPLFLNCIPENRRWGILHQTVYLNNYHVVEKLLKFSTCDINIKAKDGSNEIGPFGRKTAKDVANDFKRTEILELLGHTARPIDLHMPQTLLTFYMLPTEGGDCDLFLLTLTLASYETTFIPPNSESTTLENLLYDVWENVDAVPGRWKAVQDKVAEAAYVVCHHTYKNIIACPDKESFYGAIISAYTFEDSYLYDHLNTALRRQHQADYRPTADDLALGPYVLMYQLLLLFWDQLHRERRVTYRRMRVSPEDLHQYQVGTKFAWMSFVSSSVEVEKALNFPTHLTTSGDENVMFKIDNSSECQWQPRNIERYARYMERERVYPAGAKFLVTKRTQDKRLRHQTEISLKLVKE